MKRFGEWLLGRVLPGWASASLLGDLDEEYEGLVRRRGRHAAALWYVTQAMAIGIRYALPSRRCPPSAAPRARRPIAGTLFSLFSGLGGDVRLAIRRFGRTPVFSATAVATLAIGIGANASLFTLVNAVLFKPLTTTDPEQVVRITARTRDRAPSTQFSYREFRLLERGSRLTDVAAVHLATISLRTAGVQDQLLGELASAAYFRIRPARAAIGRPLAAPDDDAAAPPVVMVSARYWQRNLGSDPAILGRPVTINGRPFTVAGVADQHFTGSFIGAPVDVWLPLEQTLAFLGGDALEGSSTRPLTLFARLPHGAALTEVQASLGAAQQAIAALRNDRTGMRLELAPGTLLHGAQRGMAIVLLSIIGGLTVAVLLIAASNVANLLLGRALAQRGEIATRLAIGAGIFRLVRQRLVESLVLAAAAGLCGLLISYWVANAFSAVALLPGFELRLDLAPDWRVLAVTLGCAMAASAVATLGPSLAATRSDPVVWLKEGGGSIGSVRASRFRSGLVVAQVAIASLVTVAACLLVKSGGAAARLDLGFRTEGTFATDIDLRAAGYSEARARAFYQVLLEKAAAVPGVQSVALANRAPLDSSTPILRVTNEQSGPMAPDDETALDASSYLVSSRYFETVAVPLVAGRAFDPRDSRLGSRGVVINETLVRRLWPGQPPGNALGRRIGVRGLGRPPAIEGNMEVIGVARDAKYRTLGEDRQPHVYLDVEQFFAPDLTLLVHAPGVPPPVTATQAVIAGIDPSIQGFFTRTLEEHTRVSLAPARFAAAASGVVGAVAGTLGAVGLYGVIFCLVSERRRELAMCLALGATPAGLTLAVLRQGLRLAAIGVAIGLAGAVLATPLLADLLYETSPTDPVIYGAVLLGGLIVALGASYGPARAASRVDPITAMRG